MFTETERSDIRTKIIEIAKDDKRICGGAITGSASVGSQDRWSDIDLAFGVYQSFEISDVLNDFTEMMYKANKTIHHLDVFSGSWIYRVFVLANTLQVDLAFAPEKDFGSKAETFKLIFGKANKLLFIKKPKVEDLIGYIWLYALHVRNSMARKKFGQAEYFMSYMRDRILSLACIRHNLPVKNGSGIDNLPADDLTLFEEGLVKSLEFTELQRVFGILSIAFLKEVNLVDNKLELRIKPIFDILISQIENFKKKA